MEHRTNKPPPTGRVRERSKGDTTCPTTSQNPSLWYPSWLNKVCITRKDSESEWLAKDNPESNPICKLCDRAVLWVPFPSCSPCRCFPSKISCFVSTCVSSDSSFPRVRQEPSFGPSKGSPFLQHYDCNKLIKHAFLNKDKTFIFLSTWSCQNLVSPAGSPLNLMAYWN